jgi:hypothetical protein
LLNPIHKLSPPLLLIPEPTGFHPFLSLGGGFCVLQPNDGSLDVIPQVLGKRLESNPPIRRPPLQTLPQNLRNDIQRPVIRLENAKTSSKGEKWMKPSGFRNEKKGRGQLVNGIEQRMGLIRAMVTGNAEEEEDEDNTDTQTQSV